LKNNTDDVPFLDFSDEIALFETQGIDALLDRLDIILCNGNLSNSTRSIIIDAIAELENDSTSISAEQKVKNIIYFIVISPNFTILK